MTFVFLTALVAVVLVYAYLEYREAYGIRTLAKLFSLTLVFFFVKEYLQSRNWLLHHYYHANHKVWIELAGVPPFIVLGHLFIVLMTWQLAVLHIQKLGLGRHPAVLVTLVAYFTSAFSMLMENTGVIGHWWTWAMPSWWYYPNMLGAPLVDLPWERPITTAWGYFISTFWFMLLATDLPRRWTPARLLVLLGGLAALLELSRVTLFMSFWALVLVPGLPFLSILYASRGRRLPFPASSELFRERRPRWNGAVAAGLLAMVCVCVIQISVASKWLALVSLFPIVAFTAGVYRSWPLWVDCLVSLAFVLVGVALNNGNLILAGWLVLRCSLVLWGVVVVLRRTTRVDEPRRGEVAVA